jgi:hypothetical protein
MARRPLVHGYHGPRYGWWWTVNNSWYPYPRPVYPYPAYAPPPYASADEYYPNARGYTQDFDPGPSRNPQRPDYWYFCENRKAITPTSKTAITGSRNLRRAPARPVTIRNTTTPDFQPQ